MAGVARSRLTFVSDRDSQSALGLVPDRQTKEVYVSDYDGANVRRVTVGAHLTLPRPGLRQAAQSHTHLTHRDFRMLLSPTFTKGGKRLRGVVRPECTIGCLRIHRMAIKSPLRLTATATRKSIL